jgi:hypothetical protein
MKNENNHMRKAVICIAKNDAQAGRIIERLLSSNFTNDDISILMSEKERSLVTEDRNMQQQTTVKGSRPSAMGYEKHSKAPEGAATGAVTGGVLGGIIGLLAGIGTLAIPGVGPFIAAGPIMAALSGSALGGVVGLVAGGLIGLDIPEFEAKQYERKLEKGYILISVHTDSSDEIDRAKIIFKGENAEDIAVVSEKKQQAKSRR